MVKMASSNGLSLRSKKTVRCLPRVGEIYEPGGFAMSCNAR